MDLQTIKWYFLEALYRQYEHEVYKVCLYFAKDEHIAKDMTQKTFFSIYEHYENINPGRIKPYLIRTAKNITMNWLRDFKQLREGQIDDLNEENLRTLTVEEVYIREECAHYAFELTSNIMLKLREKNERWCDLVMKAYYFEIPQEQLAKEEGVNVEVIHSRLYRAKQWIRKNYQAEYDEYIRMTEG